MNKEIAPALEEVAAVLKKYDMVGLVIVGNRSHCDWRFEIEASWSCARFEKQLDGGIGLRVRSKLADYPSKDAQKATLEATVGSFVTFSDVMKRADNTVKAILIQLAKSVSFIGRSNFEE